MRDFFKAVLELKTPGEARDFFRDISTLAELQAISERWLVARMLNEGTSYRLIAAKTRVSTTTITRVAYWIANGYGGYRRMLKRMFPKAKGWKRD